MNASVDQAHRLIGARLRDPRRRCVGRVVGVDQTREAPALLVVWEGQSQAQRAELTPHDLHELVLACVAPTRPACAERDTDEESTPAVTPWRRTAGD
ncbi:hypothetical protein R6258_15360 [Halomonas sp. HP20-15]|uniref:hypothetical protein n=1 Tax=Halomonas sp. HP20-15 TaxID=3085901 RepID=UPI002980B3F1|nr:hypothetical protein [Halomonas sp. HP20-15]MDW5378301.1 hypothetical protein [Halomonas sp. HP20-15]